jgi:hypothetical protein
MGVALVSPLAASDQSNGTDLEQTTDLLISGGVESLSPLPIGQSEQLPLVGQPKQPVTTTVVHSVTRSQPKQPSSIIVHLPQRPVEKVPPPECNVVSQSRPCRHRHNGTGEGDGWPGGFAKY